MMVNIFVIFLIEDGEIFIFGKVFWVNIFFGLLRGVFLYCGFGFILGFFGNFGKVEVCLNKWFL